jgi:N-methylhydantoinase B
MTSAIRRLPSGSTTVETAHDPIPSAPDGIPLRVKVAIDSEAGVIEVDLRDNPDCQPCGLNLTECMANAAAMVGVFNSIGGDIPPNGGSARRVRVLLRENCVAGIPRHPASCSVATTNVFDRAANAVQRAFAGIGRNVGMAEVGLSLPASVSVISGRDPRADDAPFMNQLILAWTGGAGSPHSDGWLTTGGVGDGGALLRDSVEIDEMKYPIVIRAQHIVPDTEGAGAHRGAPAAFVEFGPRGCDLEAMYLSDGTVNPPLGASGGQAGAQARQYLRNVNGELAPLDVAGHYVLQPGETLLSYSTGGGGFGPPEDRDPARVRHDVAEGWISAQRAKDVYGVVVDVGELDERVGTAQPRSSRALARDRDPER